MWYIGHDPNNQSSRISFGGLIPCIVPAEYVWQMLVSHNCYCAHNLYVCKPHVTQACNLAVRDFKKIMEYLVLPELVYISIVYLKIEEQLTLQAPLNNNHYHKTVL